MPSSVIACPVTRLPDAHIKREVADWVVVEEIGEGKDRQAKPVLYFHNREKGLVLNVTNARTIEDAYGTETGDWAGQLVELFSTNTKSGN